jgi:hypothetical protein
LIASAEIVRLARPRYHLERTDCFGGGGGDALRQPAGAVFVHQETDCATVHAVHLLSRAHRIAQGLQQKAVAAKRYHNVGTSPMPGHSARQAFQRRLGVGGVGRDEGETAGGFAHGSR